MQTGHFWELCDLRILWTVAGVLGEKIPMRAISKENTANYISLESLINVDAGKNINCWCHSGFGPPGPNPLADMDPVLRIWTPFNKAIISFRNGKF